MTIELSEQEIIRREALQQLRQMGINPYPNEGYPITHYAKDILDNFNEDTEIFNDVYIAMYNEPTYNGWCFIYRSTG